ncbi:MAG: hypothetical protein JWO55_745 [Candidatus Saccharibacteria bacterium]|nr:hypothetical protein [Candidatus Saccharibacteria bacterium]
MIAVNIEKGDLTMDMSEEKKDEVALLLNKVPEVTIFFWIIKILCTTVGETAADYLNRNIGLGLSVTTYIMSALLVVMLLAQFKTKKYIAPVYWTAVVFISVVGTLITDNLTDNLGVPLLASTIVFAIALAVTFALWYRSEKTLSIHSIRTPKREAFYWAAILFTFALGTAVGDLIAEHYAIGYLPSFIIFSIVIALIGIEWRIFKFSSVLAFWAVYILTRPLGASFGDFLSQPINAGGLGLGATVTSFIFLFLILAFVTYLIVTKKDVAVNHT